jgi:peptidyl-prolyl cis-trans isomerase C
MSALRTVVVNGVEIPEALIAQEAQNHPGANGADAWRASAHALSVRALLLDRARELGLRAAPAFDEEGREETEDEALISAVLDAEVSPKTPDDEECRRFYQTRLQSFRSPDLYEASHILIEPADESADADWRAKREAEAILAALTAAPGRFAELARTHSSCPSNATGGSLGQLQRGDLAAEVEQAILALAPGALATAPVRSRFGWHIVKLARMIEGRTLPFEHVAEAIRAQLEARAWTAAAVRYTADLARAARARGVPLSLSVAGAVEAGAFVLGDMLSPENAENLGAWLMQTDPDLGSAILVAAAREEVEPAALVRRAAIEFAETANDEAWTNLISAAQNAEDPARAALAQILKQKLQPKRRSVTLIDRS